MHFCGHMLPHLHGCTLQCWCFGKPPTQKMTLGQKSVLQQLANSGSHGIAETAQMHHLHGSSHTCAHLNPGLSPVRARQMIETELVNSGSSDLHLSWKLRCQKTPTTCQQQKHALICDEVLCVDPPPMGRHALMRCFLAQLHSCMQE